MNLIEVKFKIYHPNCWTTILPEIFGDDYKVFPFSRVITQKGTETFILAKGKYSKLKNLLYLDRYSQFKPKIIGSFKEKDILFISLKFNYHNSIIKNILHLENFFPYKIFYENEYELLNFIIPERKANYYVDTIKSQLEYVSQINSINLFTNLDIIKENIRKNLNLILSPSSLEILEQLLDMGYFDFPRKISIEEAANKIGVSKGYISKVSREIFKEIKN